MNKTQILCPDHKEDLLSQWFGLKLELDSSSIPKRSFRAGEVWWTACGENIGVEINGKNEPMSRPVLIYKKLNKQSFIGLPMTSRPKNGSWYVALRFQKLTVRVVLSQIKSMSVKRLYNRIGELDESDFGRVRQGLFKLLNE